jgi:hypothetical protein
MSSLNVILPDGYIVSDIVHSLTPDDWVYILDFIVAQRISNGDYQTIKLDFETKYIRLIESERNKYLIKLNNLQMDNETLQKQLNGTRQTVYKELSEYYEAELKSNKEKLNTLTAELKNQFKQQLEDEKQYITLSMQSRIADSANIIADLRKQLTSITQDIENRYKQQLEEEKQMIKLSMQARIADSADIISDLRKQLTESKQLADIQYEQRLSEAKQNMQQQINDLRTQLKTDKAQTEEQVRKHITQLKKMQELELQHKNETITNLSTVLETYKTQQQQTNQFTEHVKLINQTLKPIVKFYSGSNEEKGAAGENLILELLRNDKRYTDSIITDTSNKEGHGDILFKWRQLKCMIEVKNKKSIYQTDMDKFTRDVTNLEKNINCAILISLHTDLFPNRNRDIIQIDFINGTPVIYTYLENSNAIHYTISCLEKIVSTSAASNEQSKMLVRHFINYYSYVRANKRHMEEAIVLANQNLKKLSKQYTECTKIYESITPDYMSISSLLNETNTSNETNASNETNTSDEIKQLENIKPPTNQAKPTTKPLIDLSNIPAAQVQIKQAYLKLAIKKQPKNNDVILSTFNITQQELDTLGGYDFLVEQAKSDFISSVVTSSQMHQIIKLRKASPKPLTRPEIAKVIPDLHLRQLNFVAGIPNVPIFFEDICEKYLSESTSNNDEESNEQHTEESNEQHTEESNEQHTEESNEQPNTKQKATRKQKNKAAPTEEPNEQN